MKYFLRYLPMAAGIFFTQLVFSQLDRQTALLITPPELKITEEQLSFKGAVHPAQSIFVATSEDTYLRDLRHFLKANHAIETKKGSGYYYCEWVKWSLLSSDTLRLYLTAQSEGNGIRAYSLLEKANGFQSLATDSSVQRLRAQLAAHLKTFYIKQYDEALNDAQDNFEAQQKDLDKLMRRKEKLNTENEKHRTSIKNAESTISETKTKISEEQNKFTSLEAETDQLEREEEQIAKEISLNYDALSQKQLEYSKLNSQGALNTKQAGKVLKAIEKLKADGEKLSEKQAKKKEAILKTENSILENGRNHNKFEEKIRESESSIEKHKSDIHSNENELHNLAKEIAEEEIQVNASRKNLESLKSSKDITVNATINF
jgi:hypothetical protein